MRKNIFIFILLTIVVPVLSTRDKFWEGYITGVFSSEIEKALKSDKSKKTKHTYKRTYKDNKYFVHTWKVDNENPFSKLGQCREVRRKLPLGIIDKAAIGLLGIAAVSFSIVFLGSLDSDTISFIAGYNAGNF